MERSPVISWLFHLRVLSLLLVLGSMDLHFVQHAYQSTITKGASVQLVFGFEYAILITMVINIAIKYALHSVDLNSETPWENKAVFLLYTELVMGFIKVILYVAFVAIMVRIYTLPLFAFRPMYYTIRNFKKAFNDVILSRRAIHNMNTLYPDATSEELQAADNVCIICREEMTSASKKLPCNHIFHTACLRSWFQRQQTCPTCRLNILRPTVNRDQQQEQRQRPPLIPNLPNIFNNAFAGPNPFHILNQHAQNVPNMPVPGPVPQAQGAPGPSNSQPQANIPQFTFPPFPFLPFMTPPPLPPQNLRSLSPEELRRMEGNERENVEARIQCLKNIQVMLDAAVVMMQQYSAAAALSMSMPQSAQPTASSSSAPNTNSTLNGATPSSSSAATESQNNNAKEPSVTTIVSSGSNSTFNTSTNVSTNTNSSDITATTNTNKITPTPSTSTVAENQAPSTADEELRRRRLQRFQQPVEQ